MRVQGALINALDEISIMNTKGVRWWFHLCREANRFYELRHLGEWVFGFVFSFRRNRTHRYDV
ncbi:hypothetical protein [Priestia megaterium]|uniref:hypothetical protein n=1 Tax=Priestia megaterium TaxID=1404 RepID=UPI0011583990|nr:hypothetical protein [Priestia megaterium]MDH3168687.1 hypothetical protein [Priestia megaterium]MDH3168714.1 hypothetical protein [Priestia megaterium]